LDWGDATAWRFGPQAASRNSIAGLVEVNHCPFERRSSLRAVGNDSPNDAWLSQTVERLPAGRTAKPRAET